MYDGMKRIGIVVLVSLLITSLLVPAPTTAEEEGAQKPEWEEGDAWAMGFEEDIEDLFAPGLDMIDDVFDEIDQEIGDEEEIKDVDYNIDGEIAYYQIYEVTEVDDDGYTLELDAGGGINVEGSIDITAELPEEGEYDQEDFENDDVPMENRTISIGGSFHYSQDVSLTIELDEDMAIKGMEMEMEKEISVTMSVENFPLPEDFLVDIWEESDLPENETIPIEYTDYEVIISTELNLDLDIDFDPALDLFQFPIKEGDEWETNESEISITGTYEGEIDIEGLPEEMQDDLEEELEHEFPIILEDLDTDDMPGFDEGEIELPPEGEDGEIPPIPLQCTGTDEVVLHDGSTTDVYVIEFGPAQNTTLSQEEPSFKMMYSEEHGFIVEQHMNLGEEAGMIMSDTEMRMESIEVDEASESKEEFLEEEEEEAPGFVVVSLIAAVFIAAIIIKRRETIKK